MKKYFIMAVAVLASLTACQQNEPEATYNDGTIKFVNAKATRAAELTAINGDFKVLGYVGTTELFNEPAVKNGEEWKTATTKYWADKTAYTFFAVYPVYEITAVDKDQSTIGYTNVKGQEDLVMAGLSMISTEAAKVDQDPAALTFKHALSRVKFQFKNGFAAGANVIVDVKDVKLLNRAGETATATLTSAGKITWTTPAATTSPIEFEFTTGDGLNMLEQAEPEATEYCYVIPTTDSKGYKLACTVDIYAKLDNGTKGNLIHTYDFSEGTVITAADKFECGLGYVYTMTVSDDLNPITFTVSVDTWKGGGSGVIDFDKTK